MKEPQEAATEAGAEGQGAFGFVHERGVVELELLEHGAEFLELVGLHRIHAREHHGLHLLEAGDGFGGGVRGGCYGVAHLHFLCALDAADGVADVAAAHPFGRDELHAQEPDLFGVIVFAGSHETHLLPFAQSAVQHLEICDDPAERVEYRVEDERLQGSRGVALRGGYPVDDGVQDGRHAFSGACGNLEDVIVAASQQVHYLVCHDLRLGGVHVYLVEYGDYLEIMVDRVIKIGDGLGLHALGSVHHQQGPFAGGYRAGDLITEIDMSGSVDEVEGAALVLHLDGMALYGDAFLALERHVVQHLIFHLAPVEGVGQLQ